MSGQSVAAPKLAVDVIKNNVDFVGNFGKPS